MNEGSHSIGQTFLQRNFTLPTLALTRSGIKGQKKSSQPQSSTPGEFCYPSLTGKKIIDKRETKRNIFLFRIG